MQIKMSTPETVYRFEIEIGGGEMSSVVSFIVEMKAKSEADAKIKVGNMLVEAAHELMGFEPKEINLEKEHPFVEEKQKQTPIMPGIETKNGIVINNPKRVNDPGFQPKFREPID